MLRLNVYLRFHGNVTLGWASRRACKITGNPRGFTRIAARYRRVATNVVPDCNLRA